MKKFTGMVILRQQHDSTFGSVERKPFLNWRVLNVAAKGLRKRDWKVQLSPLNSEVHLYAKKLDKTPQPLFRNSSSGIERFLSRQSLVISLLLTLKRRYMRMNGSHSLNAFGWKFKPTTIGISK